MEVNIFDNTKEKGIDLDFDLENGLFIRTFIPDEQAQEIVNIIQNKLNARLLL